MKQLFILCVLFTALAFVCTTAYSQSRTKCPPKRSFWKSNKMKKELVKFPGLHKPSKAEKAMLRHEKKKENRVQQETAAKPEKKKYRKERATRIKRQKPDTRNFASTRCPQ